jgi:lipid-A-disaccharide synthase
MLKDYGLDGCSRISLIPPDRTYDLMKVAYGAIAKSGTVILELALHAVPTVVTYGARWIRFIAQRS